MPTTRRFISTLLRAAGCIESDAGARNMWSADIGKFIAYVTTAAMTSAIGASARRRPLTRQAGTTPATIIAPHTARKTQRHECSQYAMSMLRARWLNGIGMMKYTFAISNSTSRAMPT